MSAGKNACRQRGGSLASITNSNVYEYALSLVEDGYIWVKGSHASEFPQKNWLKGSVRDQNGKHEGCLTLVKFGEKTGFDDISCSSMDNTAFTLCEIETS